MFICAGVRFEGHHPATAIAAFALEMDHTAFLHQLKRALPKMEMQNLRFSRQQIVTNAETFHGDKNLFDVSGRDVISEFGRRVISLFNRMQNLSSQLQLVRALFAFEVSVAIEQSYARVQIPAVVIKWTLGWKRSIQLLDLIE